LRLQCVAVAVCCSALQLQCVAVCCCVLHCAALCCRCFWIAMGGKGKIDIGVAACCSCSVLQSVAVAVCFSGSVLRCVAVAVCCIVLRCDAGASGLRWAVKAR